MAPWKEAPCREEEKDQGEGGWRSERLPTHQTDKPAIRIQDGCCCLVRRVEKEGEREGEEQF